MTKKAKQAKQVQMLPMESIMPNEGQLEGLPANPREIRDEKFQKLKSNIEKYPELLEYRSLMVYPMANDKYIIIGGNMRYRALMELGYTEAPCIVIDPSTPVDRLGAYTILDNNGFGKWDWDLLANEWTDFDLDGMGLDMHFNLFEEKDNNDRSEWKQGESNEEYEEFVDKFNPKLTTDDCYTPAVVFDAVVSWVKEEYGIDENTPIERPFFPGGDYEHHKYPAGCLVLDNPPFSIMAEIIDFYQERGIRFFLFCDMRSGGTTAIRREGVTFVATNATVVYENGASVTTAFVTNMTPELAIRTAPKLRKMIKDAQESKEEQVKIGHHANTVVVARLMKIASVDYELKREDLVTFNHCSKTVKEIFGAFGLVSELKAAELKAAELKAAELKAAHLIELEPMDYEIIAKLNEKTSPTTPDTQN